MQLFTRSENGLVWRYGGETLIVEPWGENSLRVRAAMMRDVEDDRFALLDPVGGHAEIFINGAMACIRNGNIRAVLEEDDWHHIARISFYNEKEELLFRETETGGALNLKARHFQSATGGDFRLSVTFDGNGDEHIYGMGQYQMDELDLKHCSLELAHRNSQASIPFMMSSRGYGFLWHNPAIGEVHFGKNRTTWVANSTKQMDYWVTAGNPKQIQSAYAHATGTVPMMPEYGLGFWQCKLRYWNQAQLLEVAREYKRRNLPIDVIVCDFFHWPKMGGFRLDPEFWPDPKGMVDELKSLDIELMVSVWPQIDLQSENYDEMRREGLLVKAERGEQIGMRFGGDSMFYDATNPRARQYVWDKCKRNYYDHGIRIFWLDEAEPEYGSYDFDNYRYHMGPNVRIGNIYPQMFSRGFYDGMVAEGQENPVNLVRCAWAGSQRYGALLWSGDVHCSFDVLKKQVCAGINAGIAGIAWWTTDIGGFHGGNPNNPAFRELLIRWFQWGCFCPVMRLHGDRQPTTHLKKADGTSALFTGADNEVWSFGDEAYPILVKYMRLRETMRDYTRGLMRQAHEDGMPLMRAMFYEFDDAECLTIKDQYLYGPDLLVAPVMEHGMTQRHVYLPRGVEWVHFSTGERYSGGQTLLIPAPLEEIPVFLRDGRHSEWIDCLTGTEDLL